MEIKPNKSPFEGYEVEIAAAWLCPGVTDYEYLEFTNTVALEVILTQKSVNLFSV